MHHLDFKYARKVELIPNETVTTGGSSRNASIEKLSDPIVGLNDDIKVSLSVSTNSALPEQVKEECVITTPLHDLKPKMAMKNEITATYDLKPKMAKKKEITAVEKKKEITATYDIKPKMAKKNEITAIEPKMAKMSEIKVTSVVKPKKEKLEVKATSRGKPTVPEKPKDILELNRELKMALYGTELINQAGIMLQLSQIVIAAAQSFYHRFYRGLRGKRRSYKQYPPFLVAMTCVYLSSKVEEEKRRHRDVLNVFDRLQKKNANKPLNVLDPYSRRYSKWKLFMMKLELIILCDLGYQLKLKSPHKFILNYISVLRADDKVAQKAWSYLNDSLRLPAVIEVKPEVLACSAIYLAAKYFQISLPRDPPWHQLFDAQREDIEYVSRMIMELYKIPEHCFQKQEREQDPDKGSELLDRFKLPVPPKKKNKAKKSKTRTKNIDEGASAKPSPTETKKSKYNSSSEPRPRSSKKKRDSPRPSQSRSRSRRPSKSRSDSRSARKSSRRHKKSRRKRREREGSVKKNGEIREKRRRSRSRSRERRKRRRRMYSSD